jgi:hypothetical protein
MVQCFYLNGLHDKYSTRATNDERRATSLKGGDADKQGDRPRRRWVHYSFWQKNEGTGAVEG